MCSQTDTCHTGHWAFLLSQNRQHIHATDLARSQSSIRLEPRIADPCKHICWEGVTTSEAREEEEEGESYQTVNELACCRDLMHRTDATPDRHALQNRQGKGARSTGRQERNCWIVCCNWEGNSSTGLRWGDVEQTNTVLAF